jgi:hypothetical protein
MSITYNIRVDSRDPETIWIDQFASGELDRAYGPFWSIYSARELIDRWQQQEEIVLLPEIKGWDSV